MKTPHKLLDPIRRRIRGLVSRAVVTLVNDSLKLQGLQLKVLADETLDNVERFQEYGYSSVPLPGAEAVLLCLGGHRDHPVVISVDDRRYRLKNLAAGEVALYTDEGDIIKLARGRIIEVVAGTRVRVTAPDVEIVASTKVTVTSPNVEISGALTVQGAVLSNTSIADPAGTMSEMRGTYNSHTHPGGGVPSPQMT